MCRIKIIPDTANVWLFHIFSHSYISDSEEAVINAILALSYCWNSQYMYSCIYEKLGLASTIVSDCICRGKECYAHRFCHEFHVNIYKYNNWISLYLKRKTWSVLTVIYRVIVSACVASRLIHVMMAEIMSYHHWLMTINIYIGTCTVLSLPLGLGLFVITALSINYLDQNQHKINSSLRENYLRQKVPNIVSSDLWANPGHTRFPANIVYCEILMFSLANIEWLMPGISSPLLHLHFSTNINIFYFPFELNFICGERTNGMNVKSYVFDVNRSTYMPIQSHCECFTDSSIYSPSNDGQIPNIYFIYTINLKYKDFLLNKAIKLHSCLL